MSSEVDAIFAPLEKTLETLAASTNRAVARIRELEVALEAAQAEKRKVMDSIGYCIVHEQGQTGHNAEYRVKLLRWVLSLFDEPTPSDQSKGSPK